LAKLKIPIPLIELMNKNAYRSQVIKALNIDAGMSTDTINIVDDQPSYYLGLKLMENLKVVLYLLFYVSLNVHDKTLNNAMLYSGASHNLMPKDVMEKLGLDITIPYKDLYSFDSSKVKCIGLIKDLCVTLAQILAKSMVMDIVVADILLSMACYCLAHGEPNYRVPYNWTCLMPPSHYSARRGDYTGRH
jgi:hypothetical protein